MRGHKIGKGIINAWLLPKLVPTVPFLKLVQLATPDMCF